MWGTRHPVYGRKQMSATRHMRPGKKALIDIGLYVLISLFVVGVIFAAVELDVPKYLFLR